MTAATTVLRCGSPGCRTIAEPQGGPEVGLCARHRQEARVHRGACLNCGAALLRTPELNALTGRPLQRDGAPVYRYACAAACGYTRRTRPRRQRGRA